MMHKVLADVVLREAQRLYDAKAELSAEQLKTLETLCRCVKALNVDKNLPDPVPGDTTTDDELRLVNG